MFITFEGIDGAGKTTLIQSLIIFLKKKKINFVVTREPGGTSISERIRSVLLEDRKLEMDDFTEALLFGASRRQNMVEKILPALKNNIIVICDRFTDSTIAYQGFGRKLGYEKTKALQDIVTSKIYPDLTFFLDINPKQVFDRNHKNKNREDRMEAMGLEFQKRVYKGYKKLLELEPKRILRIDATKPFHLVLKEVINVVSEKLKLKSINLKKNKSKKKTHDASHDNKKIIIPKITS